jgi:hypothetical protein
MTSLAFTKATSKPSEIAAGWIPLFISSWAALSKAPAITTTDVVPSPASISYAFEISTSIFAIGWITSICFRIVAPSFVIKTLPFESAIWNFEKN